MTECHCPMLPMDIIPGIGLDNLRFGMTRELAEAALGPPEEMAEDDHGGGDLTVAWYYWSLGISLHFDAEAAWRLITIEVSSPRARLNGLLVVGLTREELVALLRAEEAEWSEDRELGILEVEAWSASFWLEEEAVTDVWWSVMLDDDYAEIWPA